MPTITLKGPRYLSQLDEAAFFAWLENIPGVTNVRGHLATLIVRISTSKLSDEGLRELLALCRRYRIETRQLAQFETPKNRVWFRKRSAYWYRGVFG